MRYVPWKVNEDDERADGEGLVATRLTEEVVTDQVKDKELSLIHI